MIYLSFKQNFSRCLLGSSRWANNISNFDPLAFTTAPLVGFNFSIVFNKSRLPISCTLKCIEKNIHCMTTENNLRTNMFSCIKMW